MSQDFLTQKEVDALLRGATTDDDVTDSPSAKYKASVDNHNLLQRALVERAYWMGVVHALTGSVE